MDNKMSFNEFGNYVKENIKSYLPNTFADASVEIREIEKLNGNRLTGITICKPGCNISPQIYMDPFYRQYSDGREPDAVLKEIAELHLEHEKNNLDMEWIRDYEQVKKHVIPKLISEKWNTELLKTTPHKKIEDLAVIYNILLDEKGLEHATIRITNGMLSAWNGVTVEELHKQAISNLPKLLPSKLESMSEVLAGAYGEDINEMMPEEDFLFCLSNAENIGGAAAVLDEKMMQRIAKRFNNKFLIIPSSIHEVLILRTDEEKISIPEIEALIENVNNSDVSPCERLGLHPYKYVEGKLQRAC